MATDVIETTHTENLAALKSPAPSSFDTLTLYINILVQTICNRRKKPKTTHVSDTDTRDYLIAALNPIAIMASQPFMFILET